MTPSTQTLCPHCLSGYDLPAAQLDQAAYRGHCSHCQQIFLVNKALFDTSVYKASKYCKASKYNGVRANQINSAVDMVRGIQGVTDVDVDVDTAKLNSINSAKFHSESIEPIDSIACQHSAIDDGETNVWQTLLDEALSEDIDNVHPYQATDKVAEPSAVTPLPTSKNAIDYSQSIGQQSRSNAQARSQPIKANPHTPLASLLWLVGCLVLVLLLFAQYVIFNLNTLIKNPAYAARLQALCSVAICSLPSANLAMFSITKQSYSSSQVNTGNNFSDIKANIINKSTYKQLLPSLKVTVYDKAGLLGAFIAMPEDYLLSNQSQLAGNKSKSLMFTIPVAVQKIQQVTIEAIY